MRNMGKGAAVRSGFLVASGDVVGFVDADGATPPGDVRRVFEAASKYDVAVATRYGSESRILVRQPILRVWASYIFHLLVEFVFHVGLRDTQCGCKAFKGYVAKKLASKMVSNGFEFDVEALYLARMNGLSIAVVPVVWSHRGASTFSLTMQAPRMFLGLLKLKLHYLFNPSKL